MPDGLVMMKTLSVCIPVFNQEKLVVKALDSIPRRDDIEVIVYDDGSRDGTFGVITRYRDEHRDLNMRVCGEKTNHGLAYAKNRLMEQATGKYIHFFDSDDYVVTELYCKVIDMLDRADIYTFDAVTNSKVVLNVTKETDSKWPGQPLRMIRRGFLKGMSFNEDIRIAEDAPFHEAMLARNPSIVYTELPVYRYNYPRTGSLCDQRSKGAPLMNLKLKNVIYIPYINKIGGVETFCYEMGLKYGQEYDLTLIFKHGDPSMLARIAKLYRVIRWKEDMHIVCDVFIFGYAHDILDNVDAKEYVQTFHADYINRHLNPCLDDRVTKRFAVAENTAKGIREHFDWAADVQTMYNPYTVKKPNKVLNLISATRLTPEKGWNRMIQLADVLDAAKIPFVWLIFTDTNIEPPNPHMVKMPPTYDILDYIANADYLVQLSDTEGFSYSIVEALSVGTPVIASAFAVAEEQGIVNGKTGFILPMDMSEIPVEAIYKGIRKFSVTPNESHYETILAKGKAKYAEDHKDTVTVQVRVRYNDLDLGRVMNVGDIFDVKPERADALIGKGLVEIAW